MCNIPCSVLHALYTVLCTSFTTIMFYSPYSFLSCYSFYISFDHYSFPILHTLNVILLISIAHYLLHNLLSKFHFPPAIAFFILHIPSPIFLHYNHSPHHCPRSTFCCPFSMHTTWTPTSFFTAILHTLSTLHTHSTLSFHHV